jgi:hypothetical protein
MYHLAELLVMTGGHFVPSKGIVAQLLTKYSNPDISSQDLLKMISILSDNVFDDSTNISEPVCAHLVHTVHTMCTLCTLCTLAERVV